jgi:hypothetical protein
MRHSLPWVLLLTATAFSGGCVHLCSPAPEAIPVRRLPDEVLHACPPAVGNPNEAVSTKSEKKPITQLGAVSDFGFGSSLGFPACGGGGCAVFYTGGALGSGEYPLRPGLRVTEAIAVARGPILPGCCRTAPSRVTVLRRLSCGRQLAIRVDLNEALRDPRENIPIWPGDMLLTTGATCRVFGPRIATTTLTGCPVP